jgi:Pyruvate/2-oxoacid:ferredoxin oxidoreductase delta subunit
LIKFKLAFIGPTIKTSKEKTMIKQYAVYRVPTPAAANITLICLGCGKHAPAKEMYADLDGEAFVAYYCNGCAEWARQLPDKKN